MINIQDKYILLYPPKCGSNLLMTLLKDPVNTDPEDFIEEYVIHLDGEKYDRPLWNVTHLLHKHHTLSQVTSHLPENHNIDDYDVCVFGRNPYSRLVSLYHQDLCYKISRMHRDAAMENIELDQRMKLINEDPLNVKKSFKFWLQEHSFNNFHMGVSLYNEQVRDIHNRYQIEGSHDSMSYIGWSRQWPVSNYLDMTINNDIRTYKYEDYTDEVSRFLSDLNLSKYTWNNNVLTSISEFKCEASYDPCVDCNIPRAHWSVYYEDMDGNLLDNINSYYKEDFERFGYDYITS